MECTTIEESQATLCFKNNTEDNKLKKIELKQKINLAPELQRGRLNIFQKENKNLNNKPLY